MTQRTFSCRQRVRPVRERKSGLPRYSLSTVLIGLLVLGTSLVIGFTWTFIQDAVAHDYSNGETLPGATSMIGAQVFTEGSRKNDWFLILVNADNPVPSDYEAELTMIDGEHEVDYRIADSLQRMLDDCIAQGLMPVICSAYRSYELQEQLFNQSVTNLTYRGYSKRQAREETARSIAFPGTSEHQLGLAIDIVDYYNQNLNSTQEYTEVQQWLMENSWKYGFTLRYPAGKSDVTGIIYEPWHYRYVGETAAKEMHEKEICLEEYLE